MTELIKFKTTVLSLLILVLAVLLISCEGMNHIDGVVVASKTNSPLDSVQLVYTEDRHSIIVMDTLFTDEVGRFQLSRLVKCIPKCPNTTLVFNKNGYLSAKLHFEEQVLDTSLTVKLIEISKDD